MADSVLTALTAASALDGTELYYSVQGGADRKVTGAQIKTLVSASPTLVTPILGVAAGTSLALGGATIGINALAVTGIGLFSSAVRVSGGGATVASLPAASSNQGGFAFVTDATQTAITGLGLAVTGGGANKVPVYSDGTNWIIL